MSLQSKIIVSLAAVVAMSAGFWLSSMQQEAVDDAVDTAKQKAREIAEAKQRFSPIQGTILTPARKIAVPALIKDNGMPFTLDDISGHWSLLFFGYTHCPDVCPVTLSAVAQAKALATTSNQIFPDVFFISVDPQRDKVAMLSEYVQYFDKGFIGVTGEDALIKALTLQMSVVYMKMLPAEDSGASDYLVDHSSALLLLNPDGKLVAFMNPPHEPAIILKDFQTIVAR